MHGLGKRLLKGDIIDLLIAGPIITVIYLWLFHLVMLLGLSLRAFLLLKIGILSLLLIDSILNKLSEALHGNMALAVSSLLVGHEPRQGIFIGIHSPLLVGHVIASATLLVELCQTISSLLERVLKSDQVKLSGDYGRRLLVALRVMLILLIWVLLGSRRRYRRDGSIILHVIEVSWLLLLIGATATIVELIVHNFYLIIIKRLKIFSPKTKILF